MAFFPCGSLKDVVQDDKKHVIVYFPVPGRIAVLEMAFAIAGTDYQRVSVPGTDWPAIKPMAPWGTMPILRLPDGSEIGQSVAMQRYACKLAKAYPDDPVEAAKIDDFCDGVEDLSNKLMPSYRMAQADKEEFRLNWLIDTFIPFATYCTKLMGKNKFLFGDTLTMADLKLFAAASDVGSGRLDGIPKDGLEAVPDELKNWMERMGSMAAFEKLFATDAYKTYAYKKPAADAAAILGAPTEAKVTERMQKAFDSVAPQIKEQLGVEAKDLKITKVTRQVVAGTNLVFDVDGPDGKKGMVKVFVPLPNFKPHGVASEPKLAEAKWL